MPRNHFGQVVVHLHMSLDPAAGDYTRVRRVRQVLLTCERVTVIEVVVVKLSQIPNMRRWRVLYGQTSHRRLFLPLVLPLVEIPLVRMINHALYGLAGLLLRFWLRPDVVVCETHKPWVLAHALRSAACTLVLDIHGAAVEEAIAASGNRNPRKWTPGRISRYVHYIEYMESQAVTSANAIISASSALDQYLAAKYPLPASLPRSVYGSTVDTERFVPCVAKRREIRQELGVGDEHVVCVYAGSLYAWQCIDAMIDLINRVVKSGEDTVRLLVLTSGDTTMIDRVRERVGLDRQRVWTHTVDYAQMPAWLSGADIGLALREDTVINRVASPTKVGEYLACGLPVVTTPVGAGWCDWSGHPDALCTVDPGDMDASAAVLCGFLDRFRSDRQRMQAAARECALDQWSERAGVERLRKMLSHVLRDDPTRDG